MPDERLQNYELHEDVRYDTEGRGNYPPRIENTQRDFSLPYFRLRPIKTSREAQME